MKKLLLLLLTSLTLLFSIEYDPRLGCREHQAWSNYNGRVWVAGSSCAYNENDGFYYEGQIWWVTTVEGMSDGNGHTGTTHCQYLAKYGVLSEQKTCPTDEVLNEDNCTCFAPPPACSDNQIDIDGGCVDCPPHSVPNADNTGCDCVSPYVADSNGTGCVLPSSIPDENSTNPNGDCEPGYAKNSLGVCKKDSDGDRVPDEEDAYPNDSSRSSDSDSDNKCNGNPCGKDNYYMCVNDDIKIVINGSHYEHVLFWYDCSTCESYSQRIGGPCPGQGDSDTDNTNPSDDNGTSDPIEDEHVDDCNLQPELFGWKYQDRVATGAQCDNLKRLYAVGGFTDGYSVICPDKTIGCYFNRKSDSNNTDTSDSNDNSNDSNSSGSVDNNSSDPTNNNDSNSSSSIDLSNIESKLDIINSSIIKSSTSNHGALISISTIISQSSNKNHNDLTKLNSSLGSKLDGIKSAIDNKSATSANDMNPTNEILEEIRDKLSEDTTDKEEASKAKMSKASTMMDNMLGSYTAMFSSISNVINNTPTVNLHSSGTCQLSVYIYNQTADFKKGFDLFVNYLRPILLLIMNLTATYILIILAIRAYADITMRVQWLFGGGL